MRSFVSCCLVSGFTSIFLNRFSNHFHILVLNDQPAVLLYGFLLAVDAPIIEQEVNFYVLPPRYGYTRLCNRVTYRPVIGKLSL